MSIKIYFLVLSIGFTRAVLLPAASGIPRDNHRGNNVDGNVDNVSSISKTVKNVSEKHGSMHEYVSVADPSSTYSGLDIFVKAETLHFEIRSEIHHGDDFVNNISHCFTKFRHLTDSVFADKTLAKFDSVQRFLKATDDVFAEVEGKSIDDAQQLKQLLERVHSELTDSLFGTVPAYVDLVIGGKNAVAAETRGFVPDLKSLERILLKLIEDITEGTINGTCENGK